jgi:hypothetical protein
MNCSKMMLLCICFVAFTPLLWSQNANHPMGHSRTAGVLGYLDPQTGAFRPVQRHPVSEDAIAEGTVTITGTFVFNFSITLDTPVPSGDIVACYASADTYDDIRETGLDESASVQASVKGSTASCKVTIPYSWLMASPSSDTIELGYTIVIVNPSATLGLEAATRDSSHSINPAFPVPASGTTTTVSISATI